MDAVAFDVVPSVGRSSILSVAQVQALQSSSLLNRLASEGDEYLDSDDGVKFRDVERSSRTAYWLAPQTSVEVAREVWGIIARSLG